MTGMELQDRNLSRFVRKLVEQAIADEGIEQAYRSLGISRTTLYRWRRRWAADDKAIAKAERAAAKEKSA